MAVSRRITSMNPKLVEAALERTAKTWKTCVAAICVLAAMLRKVSFEVAQ